VTIKFYVDAIAFLGQDSNDEYTSELEPIPITLLTKELWEETVETIKESSRYLNLS
jgi:hypothetical protein